LRARDEKEKRYERERKKEKLFQWIEGKNRSSMNENEENLYAETFAV
jgi:hypothetical protein